MVSLSRYNDVVGGLKGSGCPFVVMQISWWLIEGHEAQARSNHGGQSLARLAERGGLGAAEALAILQDRPWARMPEGEANAKLAAVLISRGGAGLFLNDSE